MREIYSYRSWDVNTISKFNRQNT